MSEHPWDNITINIASFGSVKEITQVPFRLVRQLWHEAAQALTDTCDTLEELPDELPFYGVNTTAIRRHLELYTEWQRYPDELQKLNFRNYSGSDRFAEITKNLSPLIQEPQQSVVLSSFLKLPLKDQLDLQTLGDKMGNDVLVTLATLSMTILITSIQGCSKAEIVQAWAPVYSARNNGAVFTTEIFDQCQRDALTAQPWLDGKKH